MISPLFNQDCFKILSLFGLSPGSRFNRTELKRRTRLHNVPLDKALSLLLSSGVLRREGKYYSINFENASGKKILELCQKQYRELRELPLDVYYLLVDLIAPLSSIKGIGVFLFGSYAKLVYTDKSDVDIALLHPSGWRPPEKIKNLVKKLERIYQKKVEVHYFEKGSFYRNKRDPVVKGILKDGIKLIS